MSIYKNFTYNTLLNISSYIISLLIFPYISRILGVESMGIVGFVDSMVNYFIILATLGINTVGIRAIALCGKDLTKRSQVFSEIMTLSILLTFTAIILYSISVFFIPKLNIHKNLYYIGLTKLLFTPFLIEWFYNGIENFKFITIRSLFIKIIYALSIILFIKGPNDIPLYFILSSIALLVNCFINLFHSRNFVSLKIRNIKPLFYLKEVFSLGMFQILVSLYTTFNLLYLGFVSNYKEVGYYYTASKIYIILTVFFTSFTSVMLPRMTSLIANNNRKEFDLMINKSFDLLLTISIPLIIGGVILAPQIIDIVSGTGYEGAIIPMRILMPLVLIAGLSQINGIQVLIPNHKDKILLTITPIVAFVGLTLNFFLVKKYGAIGTSVVMFISEFIGLFIGLIYSIKNNLFSFPINSTMSNIFYSIPYIFICYVISNLSLTSNSILIFAFCTSLFYFLFVQLKFIKNNLLIKYFDKIISYVNKV